MKKLILFCSLAFLSTSLFCQEEAEASGGSLIADIMNVAPVTVAADESTKEANDEYQKTLDSEVAKVDELLAKHGSKFKEDVGDVIEKFNKVLAKGIEKDVNAEKRKVATSVHSLSMGLLKSKKGVLMDFNNRVTQAIRKLPSMLVSEKEKEVKEIIDGYKEQFDVELKANQQVIDSFKSTEHLQKNMGEEGGDS